MIISVPCRSSSEVDLKTPLKKFIQQNYGSDVSRIANEAVDKLHEMRSRVLLKLRDKSSGAAEDVAIYHDTLLSLEPRVPMSETEARINWKWADVNGKNKVLCTSAYERANLIFCFGAIQSQVAESVVSKDLKMAVTSLKLAAGAFDYLVSNCHMFGSALCANTTDILETYATIMQAQAHECIFLKAEQGSMSPGLVAKLAAKTRDAFEDAHNRCTASNIKPYVPKEWAGVLSAKAQTFAALSHFYQSKVCEQSSAAGERVRRLMTAYELLKSVRSNTPFNRQKLDEIKAEREVAVKENDIVYHLPVPSVKDLAPVDPEGALGKIELPIPLAKGKAKDLFSFLVPMAVMESKNQAEVMHRSLISAEAHRIRELTSSLNAVMVSLNLPSAIQIESHADLHDDVLRKAEVFRQTDRLVRLREKVHSLPSFVERNQELLNQQKSLLDDEEKTDDDLRKQFGDQWRRQSSKSLTRLWREEMQKMFAFLAQTPETDRQLLKRFEDHAEMFELLAKPKLELLAVLNRDQSTANSASTPGSESSRQAVAQVCSQIETLKSDRQSFIDQLEALKLPDDTVNELLALHQSNSKITEQTILDMLNRELEGLRSFVRASEKKQEELLSELQAKYEICFGRVASGEPSNLVTRLNAAAEEFTKLEGDVEEGAQFYAELTTRLMKLQDKIDDFCLARKTEKAELLSDITSNMSRVNINDSPMSSTSPTNPVSITHSDVAGPARPPPTYTSPPTTTTTGPPARPPSSMPPPPPSAPTPFSPVAGPQIPGQPSAPVPGYAQPGIGWQQPANPYGYPVPGGMPMYGYYPGFPFMPHAQMPPMPMMPGQMAPQPGFGQPPTQQQQQQHPH